MRDSLVLSLAAALAALGCSAGPGGGTRDAGPGGSMDAGPGGGTDAGPGAGTDSGGPPPPPPDAGPPGPDAGCEATTPVPATIVGDPPDMLLVVDISGSMCVSVSVFPPSGDTRLEVMRRALDGLVTSKDARINFGMMLFPGDNACAPGTVRNGVAPRNASAIRATLGGLTTDMFGCALRHSGATPTHTSLDAARTYYGTIPVNPVGQFVLLATDGLPNCGPPLPDGGTEETVDETVAAIEALFAAGISTYVLGFGDSFGGGGTALNRMATAGGTSRPYNARTAAELDTALDAIAASVIPPSCTVMLDGPSRDPRLFRVSFDSGPLIARDESRRSGWDYDAATNTITFYGAECARVQSGTVTNVEVDFGCPGPLI